MIRHVFKTLKRGRKGAVYIEFAMSALILMGLAIGITSMGAKEIDVIRDNRTVWSLVEMAAQLDAELPTLSASDIANIGRAGHRVSSLGASEDYQIIVTAYQFNIASVPSIAWQGSTGPSSANSTKVSFDSSGVYHEGQSYVGRSDEHLIFVELFRQRRGLGFNVSDIPSKYAAAMALRQVP
jgi:Flp pilus assembly protein TadG